MKRCDFPLMSFHELCCLRVAFPIKSNLMMCKGFMKVSGLTVVRLPQLLKCCWVLLVVMLSIYSQ